MSVAVIPARVSDRPGLLATLAATLGANPTRIDGEGLSFTRRQGREAPAGTRTATLRAVTACRVAVVPEALLDREALAELAAGRRAKGL